MNYPILGRDPRPWSLLVLLSCLALGAPSMARGQEEEEEEPQYAAGLIATYRTSPQEGGAGGAVATRVDEDLQFVWRGGVPDGRLPAGKFSARWEGKLFTIAGGDYRFYVYAGGGRVRLKLGDAQLLAVDAGLPAWHVSDPVKLGYAHTSLELEFEQTGDEPMLRLDWSGPQFAVEPIPDRHLFHEPKKSPSRAFDEGRVLARALRCGACHAMPDRRPAISAPALTHLQGNVDPAWLVAHLTSTEANTAARRMPTIGVEQAQARDIAAYLLSTSKDSAEVKAPKSKEIPPPEPEGPDGKKKKPKPRKDPNSGEGERLARSVGCLACHTIGPLGTPGLFSGGDLTAIARKRPPEFFVRWLDDPAKVNADHRMPVFKLSELERADLTVYLMTLRGEPDPTRGKPDEGRSGNAKRGLELVKSHQCAACHRIEGASEKPTLRGLDVAHAGCFGEPDAAKHRPGYRLDDAKRKSLIEYLGNASPRKQNLAAELDGVFVLRERNCTACHARGTGTGLAELAPKITALDAVLLPVQAALLPPSLNGVGDKLTDEALDDAITLKREPLRPWLRVRMPKFALATEESQALRGHLVDHDRIPDLPPPAESASDDTAQRLAARRLVTSDGFGCTSCHKIGKSEPVGVVNIAAHGTDLTLVGSRLRKSWFDRWVRNPARIIPRMEMPAIQLPVKGVLHDDVNEQLAAVWKVLNESGFNPPPPNAVRIVRSRNLPELKERANVLTDVFTIDEKMYVSPIVIGLPNRHNILFDLETNRLEAWWTGDTAAERTKGKSWYWEPGGAMVMKVPQANELRSDSIVHPELRHGTSRTIHNFPADGQNIARLDSVVQTATGVTIEYRLSGRVKVRQTFEPLPSDPKSPLRAGFRRTIELEGTDDIIYLNAFFGLQNKVVREDAFFVADDLAGRPRFRFRDEGSRGAPDPTLYPLLSTGSDGHSSRIEIDYQVDLPIDTFPTELPPFPSPPQIKLDIVPGFDAVQLPMTVAEMPTGLAWRKDRSLVVASLKGRIFNARDMNDDTLEDRLEAISHDMATPYGLAVAEVEGPDGKPREVVDVIDKTALVRLHDDDGDGFCERSEVVADGWGHTDDYHDWAVGLPKFGDGGYYVALPCQQDERDEAKAKWRGLGLKLLPRTPTKDDPRLFSIEPFCGGLRFPMGLAVNREGALFASDNQGNYNPFNEINHLRDGKRFGFINKLEAKPDFNPPVESPAIELPHPWTRSVNGMCFLYTPEHRRLIEERANRSPTWFGPYEGHLVGCEYNDKSLFRMSLEKIGDTYQGAVYPMTVLPAAGAPTFEGPTVCEVSPYGDIYVGNMQDSGWGGGRNTGSIVRLRPSGKWPAGIREIRAAHDGFVIEFTEPVPATIAENRKNYSLESFRRISTPQYGGSDVDRGSVKITKLAAADDGRSVRVTVDALKPGFCYEFHLSNFAEKDKTFFPAEAFYTMKRVP